MGPTSKAPTSKGRGGEEKGWKGRGCLILKLSLANLHPYAFCYWPIFPKFTPGTAMSSKEEPGELLEWSY